MRSPKPYTAIVYFHGIGRQRRYEEISRLIDGLDKYSFYSVVEKKIRIRQQKNKIEPGRGTLSDDIGYISARRIISNHGSVASRSDPIRIYEAYWSHALAGGYSGLSVLLWLVARLINPFRGLFRVWRSQPRLKLAQLYGMQSEHGNHSTVGPYAQLETIYRDFENWPARRRYPRGSFRQFKKYLRDRNESKHAEEVIAIARKWRQRFVISQVLLTLFAFTIVIMMIDLCGWLVIAAQSVGAWQVYQSGGQLTPSEVGRFLTYIMVGSATLYVVRKANMFCQCMFLI